MGYPNSLNPVSRTGRGRARHLDLAGLFCPRSSPLAVLKESMLPCTDVSTCRAVRTTFRLRSIHHLPHEDGSNAIRRPISSKSCDWPSGSGPRKVKSRPQSGSQKRTNRPLPRHHTRGGNHSQDHNPALQKINQVQTRHHPPVYAISLLFIPSPSCLCHHPTPIATRVLD